MQQGLSLAVSRDPSADLEVENLMSGINESSPHKIDDELAKATLQVLETGRLTPLIKEELKCKIQARRHSLGQEEFTVEFKKPRSYSLTPEELRKVETRKERNRLAAQKFRHKRKMEHGDLETEVKRLENENKRLQTELEELRVEREQVLFALSQVRTPLDPTTS